MISRRSFLKSLAAQPLVLGGLIQFDASAQTLPVKSMENVGAEYVIISGWVLLKSDLLATEK